MSKPALFDYIVFAVILILPIVEWQWYGPRCLRAIRAGVSGARQRVYRAEVIALWLVTFCLVGLWIAKVRPWGGLRLGASGALRLDSGLLLAAIVIALFVLQMQKIQKALQRPRVLATLREKLAPLELVAPANDGERRGFWLLSLSAGICEEVIYRGFVLWLITAWAGLIAGIIISSAIFGFMHMYLGAAHVPKTALIGLLFALVVVASGSLWPAMVIHAAMDLSSGEISFRVSEAARALSEPPPLTS